MAASLRNELGAEVDVVDGSKGELTVLVDGKEVARKGDSLPAVEQVVEAVRRASLAGARG